MLMSSQRKSQLKRTQLTTPIEKRIFILRGERIMLSFDIAALYGIEPKALVQAVKRNIDRFPEDFMFQLTAEEFQNLKSQIVTSSWDGIRRARPYAFTEQGSRCSQAFSTARARSRSTSRSCARL